VLTIEDTVGSSAGGFPHPVFQSSFAFVTSSPAERQAQATSGTEIVSTYLVIGELLDLALSPRSVSHQSRRLGVLCAGCCDISQG